MPSIKVAVTSGHTELVCSCRLATLAGRGAARHDKGTMTRCSRSIPSSASARTPGSEVPTAAHHDPAPEAAASREKAKVVAPPAPAPTSVAPRPPLAGSTLTTVPLCRTEPGRRGARGLRTGRWRSRREETGMVRAASIPSMRGPSAGRIERAGPVGGRSPVGRLRTPVRAGSWADVPAGTIGNTNICSIPGLRQSVNSQDRAR
jgi:hypothetical protein